MFLPLFELKLHLLINLIINNMRVAVSKIIRASGKLND